MNTYGLIGKKLGHSFSKKYFTEKFQKEQIENSQYELFELSDINKFPQLIERQPTIQGLNVTIPYKQEVMAFLDGLDDLAERIGAVNVIKFTADGQKIGFNSDCIGFSKSLINFLPHQNLKALVLGTGGASKAVVVALEELGIAYQLVSRKAQATCISYEAVTAEIIQEHLLLINTTPLGMYPNVEGLPALPYEAITEKHLAYDLVYNPTETAFMKAILAKGGKAKHGLEMLHLQAEAAWEIWNS